MSSSRLQQFVIALIASGATAIALAQAASGKPAPAAAVPAPKSDPRAAIVKKFEGLKLEDIRISPVTGIYEITRGASVSYMTTDGRYEIVGDMIDVDADANISENRRRAVRTRLLETIPESEMLVYSPKDPKYTITVFTDIDCGYCRRLHERIGEYNRLGIRVRYLFFPRSGPNTESWHKAEQVWCSPNRTEALTRAKKGEPLKAPKCPTDIIARDFELGQQLAVEGTPAIFLPSGEMLPGYLPPGQLAKYLKTGSI
jgi:thiol:disulfide interchange protein DsbC